MQILNTLSFLFGIPFASEPSVVFRVSFRLDISSSAVFWISQYCSQERAAIISKRGESFFASSMLRSQRVVKRKSTLDFDDTSMSKDKILIGLQL